MDHCQINKDALVYQLLYGKTGSESMKSQKAGAQLNRNGGRWIGHQRDQIAYTFVTIRLQRCSLHIDIYCALLLS